MKSTAHSHMANISGLRICRSNGSTILGVRFFLGQPDVGSKLAVCRQISKLAPVVQTANVLDNSQRLDIS